MRNERVFGEDLEMKDCLILKEKFAKLYEDGWRVDQVQKENGFMSILYINETRKQLVLAFKGVQLEIRDLFLKG